MLVKRPFSEFVAALKLAVPDVVAIPSKQGLASRRDNHLALVILRPPLSEERVRPVEHIIEAYTGILPMPYGTTVHCWYVREDCFSDLER